MNKLLNKYYGFDPNDKPQKKIILNQKSNNSKP